MRRAVPLRIRQQAEKNGKGGMVLGKRSKSRLRLEHADAGAVVVAEHAQEGRQDVLALKRFYRIASSGDHHGVPAKNGDPILSAGVDQFLSRDQKAQPVVDLTRRGNEMA